jgi:hypothetical protein
MEVRRRPFDPLHLPWAVSQCPFDPYQAGAKVYRAYQVGGRPAPQTTLPSLRMDIVQVLMCSMFQFAMRKGSQQR